MALAIHGFLVFDSLSRRGRDRKSLRFALPRNLLQNFIR
jgi:hypothetical protein